MKRAGLFHIYILFASVIFLSNCGAVFALEEGLMRQELSERLVPEVVVSAQSLDEFDEFQVLDANGEGVILDSSHLFRGVPGANYNSNGPLSGQVQYRGMFGPRINYNVNGLNINSGGPNWMDPPLQYAPGVLLESVELNRGIAPISSGIETIGGTLITKSLQNTFTQDDEVDFQGQFTAEVNSVNNGFSEGGMAGVANSNHRIFFTQSTDAGDDTRFNGGKIRPTKYTRNSYGVGYGYQNDQQEIAVNYQRFDTDDVGTPALPMDIIFFDSDFLKGESWYTIEDLKVYTKVYYTHIDHLMDNYSLRHSPVASKFRANNADGIGLGYNINGTYPVAEGELTFGIDGHYAENNAEITNPNNSSFFVDNIHNAERKLYSAFGEWRKEIDDQWMLEFGTRYTYVQTDSDEIIGPSTMAASNLANTFNSAQRTRTDDNIDWLLKLSHQLTDELELQVATARKTRSPSYLERYAWLPMEASGGLADGNTYVGDLDLKPEVAHEVELGANWQNNTLSFSPRGFYRYVTDYIQGIPSTNSNVIMVSTMNGDTSPLQWANVDAKFYGVDSTFGLAFNENWNLDGTISYVRAKRDDIDDDLYRIAPLNGTVALNYNQEKWSVRVEGVFADEQDKVSSVNEEETTAGYGLVNLFATFCPRSDIILSVGIDNVLDKSYEDHLAGYNRATNDDIGLRHRIPGTGRNVYGKVVFNW